MTQDTAERWRPVTGFEREYEVSNLGRVRSLDREVFCSGPNKGAYVSRKRGRVLRPGRMPRGHQSVVLGRAAGSHCVHELVLTAFIGPRPHGMEARHLDGNEANNRSDNLVWDCRGNNGRDKKWHKGVSRYKLTPDDVRHIKTLLASKVPGRQIGSMFGVTESNISCIRTGKIHSDV